MPALLVAVVVAWAPVRLVHSVADVPVGVVELTRQGSTVTYRARHVFRDDEAAFETSWDVRADGLDDAGVLSELQWLSTKPKPGCLSVREERTRQLEDVCLDADGTGRIGDVRFRGAWNKTGELERIDLLSGTGVVSRFVRSSAEVKGGVDPFAQGFAISGTGARLKVQPSTHVTRVEVSGVDAPSSERCLVAAKAFVSTHGGVVEVGLVEDDGRAWPHAWVRLPDGSRVDPTRAASVAARESVVFSPAQAGSIYLELAAGTRVVLKADEPTVGPARRRR